MWQRANVKAPESCVVVESRSCFVVLSPPSSFGWAGLFGVDVEGYNHAARLTWAAISETWFALLKARCALTKTRMFAIARDKGRVSPIAAHARGFVAMMMESSE